MTFTDTMKEELAKPLNKAHVKPPAPGKHGDYIEGWRVIDEANRIFGFDGWTRETVAMELTAIFEENGKWTAGYRAKVRVTAAGIVREGTGCGSGEKQRNAVEAHESAIKEAETDAMKRALMTFGNPFGLALYDKTKANVAEAEPEPPQYISEAQRNELITLAQSRGVALNAILKFYAIPDLRELFAVDFEGAKQGILNTPARTQQKVAA